jgi:hypothetical protein
MADHLARARALRRRAAECQLAAQNSGSAKFGECYRLLEKHYYLLAKLEEDFFDRQDAVLTAARLIAAE